jgi:hypothetical protein
MLRHGQLIVVDCQPSADRDVAAAQHQAWRQHLQRSYSRAKSDGFLRAWAREDVYVPLEAELELMRRAALTPVVVWRKGPFAVIRSV